MKILGIETSCDETAAAIVDSERNVLANVVLSQISEHTPYGGVVPEIAARAHMDHLERLIAQALKEANCSFDDIDAVAVTGGPGLIGGVIVGVMTAKAIAAVHNKPFIAVNHLEGHALTVRLSDDVAFPYLLLLASGGHCQFLMVHGVGNYTLMGSTMDDALGEAFDKVAKMLGLGFPGGPRVEQYAKQGDANKYALPTPLKGRNGCNFSFAGLKTAVRLLIQNNSVHDEPFKADVCAAFQKAACDCVIDRASNAIAQFMGQYPDAKDFVLAGGVAANQAIRSALAGLLAQHDMRLVAPPVKLCTDNAAMIAWAGLERFRLGQVDALTFEPLARWPLAPHCS